jgi:hypothetical protein
VQLKSGDNEDMDYVEKEVAKYITNHPMPHNLHPLDK